MSNLTAYQRQSLYETTLAQDIDSSTTSILVVTAPSFTLSSGSCYVAIDSDNSSKFEICEVTAISGTTLTVTRGLATYEGGSSSAASHSAGAKVLMGASWKQFEAIKDAIATKADIVGQTFTGLIDFSGTGHAGIKVNSLTTAQRTALSASNGMLVYDSTIGELYQYIGGAWSAVSAGSTQPNASETVAGKIELATNAEMGTATSTGGTGARLVIPNDQLVKTSSGASDENKIVVLGATGKINNGFINTGTSNNEICVFDGTGYPAADGSQITNLTYASRIRTEYFQFQGTGVTITRDGVTLVDASLSPIWARFSVPSGYSSVSVKVIWNSAITGDINYQTQYIYAAAGEAETISTATSPATSSSGGADYYNEINVGSLSGVTGGDYVVFEFTRNGAAASDTLAGSIFVAGLEVTYS